MKKPKTFTIDERIYKRFDELSKKNSLNKSLFIQNKMNEYIFNCEMTEHNFKTIEEYYENLKNNQNELC